MGQVQRNYTEDQILAHAAKCGGKRNLREIIITDDDGVQVAYLVKKPNRNVVLAVTAANEKNDTTGATKILIGCILEGDMELMDNDGSVFLELTENVSKLLSQTKGEIKKL